MKALRFLMFLPLAGCQTLSDALATNPDVVTDVVAAGIVAKETGIWEGLLNTLTVAGVPPYITAPIALLLSFKRSRGHLANGVGNLVNAGKDVVRAIGPLHSSKASEKAAKS